MLVQDVFMMYLSLFYRYIKLIKESDPADYQKNRFNEFRTRNFKVYVVTKNPIPPEELMELCYPIRIHVPVT